MGLLVLFKMTYEDFKKEFNKKDFGVSDTKLRDLIYPMINKNKKNVVYCPKGACMWCEQSQEQVSPILAKFCPSCAKKLYERNTVEGEKLHMEFKKDFNGICFYCRKKSYNIVEMNLRLCTPCLKKHKRRQEELDEIRNNKKKKTISIRQTP